MLTRQDYLNGKCTHSEYYAQFVTEGTKKMLISRFGIKKIKEAFTENEHFNSIRLQEWDSMRPLMRVNMKDYGDYLTLAGSNCILREAARQIAKEN